MHDDKLFFTLVLLGKKKKKEELLFQCIFFSLKDSAFTGARSTLNTDITAFSQAVFPTDNLDQRVLA